MKKHLLEDLRNCRFLQSIKSDDLQHHVDQSLILTAGSKIQCGTRKEAGPEENEAIQRPWRWTLQSVTEDHSTSVKGSKVQAWLAWLGTVARPDK